MRDFLVFAYPGYYPAGGWRDFVGDFDSESLAQQRVLELDEDDAIPLQYAQIVGPNGLVSFWYRDLRTNPEPGPWTRWDKDLKWISSTREALP